MEEDASDLNVDIEYVADAMLDPSDPLYSDWIKVKFWILLPSTIIVNLYDSLQIFEHFQKSATEEAAGEEGKKEVPSHFCNLVNFNV